MLGIFGQSEENDMPPKTHMKNKVNTETLYLPEILIVPQV